MTHNVGDLVMHATLLLAYYDHSYSIHVATKIATSIANSSTTCPICHSSHSTVNKDSIWLYFWQYIYVGENFIHRTD